jgi:hypothetical protein
MFRGVGPAITDIDRNANDERSQRRHKDDERGKRSGL